MLAMGNLRSTVNGALTKATGYRLTRATTTDLPGNAGDTGGSEPQRLRRRVRELSRELDSARAEQKRRAAMRRKVDDEADKIIRRVGPRTMTGFDKLYGLVLATRYVVQHSIPGDIVECGVWRGGSMQAAALTLMGAGVTDRDLHLFDTFEGMPPPTEHDRRVGGGAAAADLLAKHSRDHKVWAVADLDDVQQGMREVDYPAERVHFHKGMVEETIPDQAPDKIAILRLDTDWYESTRHELEHLYHRLVPGGILIIDDYGHWEGARKAVEEFFADLGDPVLLTPLGPGRIAVKPF